jgi:hypothetical protein
MVDAFHFFMNILLATGNGRSPYKIAVDFTNEYFRKRVVNAQRQRDGYTGLEKCPGCKRALEDCTATADNGDTYCTGCGKVISRA